MMLASLRTVLRARPLALTPLRALSTSTPARSSDFNRPGPPPLPAAEQAEFERLQKEAEVAPPADMEFASPEEVLAAVEELEHRDLRRTPRPEFEGDTNPVTGEVGGPKRDPFQASKDDWAYSGRVTDF